MSAVVGAEQIPVAGCRDEDSEVVIDKVQIANHAGCTDLPPVASALCGCEDASGSRVGIDVLEAAGIDHICCNAYIVGGIPMCAAVIATIDVYIVGAGQGSA